MAIRSTDTLKEGMVLDAPIKNPQGQVLFGVNHILKQKHIDMLMAWGIPEADIVDDEADDEELQRIEELKTIEIEKMKERFIRSDMKHPVVNEIVQCVAERLVMAKLEQEKQLQEEA